MYRYCKRLTLLFLIFLLAFQSFAWAASGTSTIQRIRFSQNQEKVRIVLDLDNAIDYTATLEKEPYRLVLDLAGGLGKGAVQQTTFNDPFISSVKLLETEPGKVRATIDLKQAITYKIFALKAPNRLVIDLIKKTNQKTEEEVAPGLKHIFWSLTESFGPIQANILDLDPKAGFIIKPVLSNEAINGLETVASMSTRAHAIAAINGSYFSLNGEIIGMLKIDGDIISTPDITRTAVGIMADGRVFFDQVDYEGSISLPDGKSLAIAGVNRERGENELILYNGYYGTRTGTNTFGTEYVIDSQGKVVSVSTGNSPLTSDTIVLSAHGDSAKALANLKIGDQVKITQSLGANWDQAVHVLGAGPMLVKEGSVFLTTKTEDFGSDVAGGRAPRTAIGITKEGHIIFVVVDGRQATSRGFSLLELALFMQELGATGAMNLDGGGSSEMVIKDTVVNNPSDGHERKVGDALVIVNAKLAN
jgi:exopolysaccharide biosynthesis protein